MPNVTGTLVGAMVLQRALDLVFTVRPILRNVCLGFRDLDSGSIEAKFNQTVNTRTLAIPTVQNFGTGAGDTADVDVPVTLNQFKEVHYAWTPQEYSGTDRDLVDEHAMPMAVALANHMVDAIAANWTAANFPVNTVKASGWDYTHLTVVRAALIGRGVPMGQRWFYACNATVYQSLLTDTLVVTALNNPNNEGAIMTGRLPKVASFGLEEYPAILATGNQVAFAGAPDSVVYASRVPKNPEEVLPGAKFPGILGTVTEPKSGLSVMVNQWIGTDLKVNNRLVWMYGTAKGNGNNGQRITTV